MSGQIVTLHPAAERLLEIMNGNNDPFARWDTTKPPRIVARWAFPDQGYRLSLSALSPEKRVIQVGLVILVGSPYVDLKRIRFNIKQTIESMQRVLVEHSDVVMEFLFQGAYRVYASTDPASTADIVVAKIKSTYQL